MEFSPSNVIGTPSISNSSTDAKTMVTGQIIEHVCIQPKDPPEDHTLRNVLLTILGLLLLLGLIAALYFLFCRPKPKAKKTRAVNVTKKKEEAVPLVPVTYMTYAPVPQALTVMPQQYV